MNKNNEMKLVALLALAIVLTSCGGGGKKGGGRVSTDDTINLPMPTDRAVQVEQKKSVGSLNDLSTDEHATDIKGVADSESIGAIAKRLSDMGAGNIDAVNSELDAFLTELMNNDVKKAEDLMLARITKATNENAAEKEKVRIARKETAELLDTQRERALTQAESDRLAAHQKVIADHGGADAVAVLTTLRNGSESVIKSRIARVDQLVTNILEWQSRMAKIHTASLDTTRSDDIASVTRRIGEIKTRIEALQAGAGKSVAEQKAAIEGEIKGVDKDIWKLQQRIALVSQDFNAKFLPRVEALRKAGMTKEAAEKQARVEVINSSADLATVSFAIDALQDKLDVLSAEKKGKEKNMKNVKPIEDGAAVANTVAQAKAQLVEQEAKLAAFEEKENTGNFVTGEAWTVWPKFLFDGVTYKKEQLQAMEIDADKAMMKLINELKSIDPEQSVKPGKLQSKMEERKIRSREEYAEAIRAAFAKEREEFEKLGQEHSAVDSNSTTAKSGIRASFTAEMKKKSSEFDAKVKELDGVLKTESEAASAEFKTIQGMLQAQRDRISANLKVISACQNAFYTTEASKRVLVEQIVANVENNNLLAMSTFDDFNQTITKVKKSKHPDVTYTGTTDFNRFVSILMGDDGKVVAFESNASVEAVKIPVNGWGILEGQDPDALHPKRGALPAEMTRYRNSFSAPLSFLSNGSYQVVTCTELKDGSFEVKSRKVKLSEPAAPRGKKARAAAALIQHNAEDEKLTVTDGSSASE